MMMIMMIAMLWLDIQLISLFHDLEKKLKSSEIMQQGIKVFIYTTLACHVGACFLHVIACFDVE